MRGFLRQLIDIVINWLFSRPTMAEKQAKRNEEAAREFREIEDEQDDLTDADRRERARRWVRPDDDTDSGW